MMVAKKTPPHSCAIATMYSCILFCLGLGLSTSKHPQSHCRMLKGENPKHLQERFQLVTRCNLGHDFASMSLESHWLSSYKSNSYDPADGNLSTSLVLIRLMKQFLISFLLTIYIKLLLKQMLVLNMCMLAAPSYHQRKEYVWLNHYNFCLPL